MGVSGPGTDLEPRRSLLLRGVLDMCVLALLKRQPDHVYGLVGRLSGQGLGTVSFGSVYPLVTRLRQNGLVDDTPERSLIGPPRVVLSLTPVGRSTLARWTEQWQTVNEAVVHLLAPPGDEPRAVPTSGEET